MVRKRAKRGSGLLSNMMTMRAVGRMARRRRRRPLRGAGFWDKMKEFGGIFGDRISKAGDVLQSRADRRKKGEAVGYRAKRDA